MRLLWLPEVLRAAGLTVREVAGWRDRGSADWGPDTSNAAYRMALQGIICHATAGKGTTAGEISVILNGSTTAPPPIAQLYLARNGDWHVVASGRCNHARIGWAGPLKGFGNYQLVGIEAGNDNRGEPWPAVQVDSYQRGVAALAAKLGLTAAKVAAHREHQPYPPPAGETSTKTDPLGIEMGAFRRRVAALLDGGDAFMGLPDDKQADIWRNTGSTQRAVHTNIIPKVDQLVAAAAEDKTRDVATMAAIQALAAAGGVDSAPIVAAIERAAAATNAVVAKLQAEVAHLQSELDDRDERLAAALSPPE